MRMSPRWIRALVLGALAVSLAGCDDPLAPVDVAGTYVLQSAGGESLPAPLYETETTRVVVYADTLRLLPDGSGVRSTLQAYAPVYSDGAPEDMSPPELVETALEFRMENGQIEISFVCPPWFLALCAEGPHLIADPTADGLRVTAALTTERLPLVYEVVNP